MPHMFMESGRLEGTSGSLHPASCGSKEHVQERFEWLQGWRFHSLAVGTPPSRFDHQ